MKINLFKKENSFKRKNFQFNPNFYWKIVVGFALLMIIFSFFFGSNLFNQINQEPILAATNNSGQVPMVDQNRIEKVLNYFSEREKKSTEILNSPAPVVDPSL